MQKRHVLVCEDSLCPRELPDVSGPGLGETGRYNNWAKMKNKEKSPHAKDGAERGQKEPRPAGLEPLSQPT